MLGCEPIVRVVHYLMHWYDWRDNQSAGITAAYCDGTRSMLANERSPAKSSDDLSCCGVIG